MCAIFCNTTIFAYFKNHKNDDLSPEAVIVTVSFALFVSSVDDQT